MMNTINFVKKKKRNYKDLYGSLDINSSSLLSYSVYSYHSALAAKSGFLLGIGDNKSDQISSSLTKIEIRQFIVFSIKDDNGRQLAPISTVCCLCGTFYMISKISGDGRQLVYFDCEIKDGDTVSLFGGYFHAAAVSDKGEVIFINRFAVKNSPNSRITAVSLPDGEKASSVACLEDSVIVLSSNGRVFRSIIESGSSVVRFSSVSELSGYENCLGVKYKLTLHGSQQGRPRLWTWIKFIWSTRPGRRNKTSFTEMISSLLGYEIRAAYAGFCHSLFVTSEGKVLSCGCNSLWRTTQRMLKPWKSLFTNRDHHRRCHILHYRTLAQFSFFFFFFLRLSMTSSLVILYWNVWCVLWWITAKFFNSKID